MPTLGEELKQRREARGITLADISEATRIGTRFLKAIESDNYSVLPGGIFTRSFIRAYARQVGMNEDEALALYQQQFTGQPEEPSEQPVEEPSANIKSVSSIWRTAAIVLGGVLLAGLIVFAIVRLRATESSSTTENPAELTPSPVPQETRNRPRISEAKPTPSVEVGPRPSETTSPQTPHSDSLAVTIEATNGECWVSYSVDTGNTTSMTLKPGETKDLPPAKDSVTLIVGNRLHLKLRINGRPASFPPATPNFSAQVVISRDTLQDFFP